MIADVLVIGGGPVGLAAAIAARRKGFHVILADGCEPPIDKACGEGVLAGRARSCGTTRAALAARRIVCLPRHPFSRRKCLGGGRLPERMRPRDSAAPCSTRRSPRRLNNAASNFAGEHRSATSTPFLPAGSSALTARTPAHAPGRASKQPAATRAASASGVTFESRPGRITSKSIGAADARSTSPPLLRTKSASQ